MLRIEHLCKSFDGPVLSDVSLTLDQGRVLALLGPSGCGKTTLLRVMAGLEEADSGRVSFDGRDMTGVPPHKRNFGLMFQEFALFPHKTAAENVAFGLEMQNMPRPERRARVDEMLELVGLSEFAGRNVGELSGGERQRVALARSLAPRPRLLMLDEPLGALDRALRERLLVDIRRILTEVNQTAVFVTHDQSEALAAADVIAVMNQGRLLQVAEPELLYRQPADETVARFLGFRNIFAGSLEAGGVRTEIGLLYPHENGIKPQGRTAVLIRPEAVRVLDGDGRAESGETVISGRVCDRLFRGPSYQVAVRTASGAEISFELPGDSAPPEIGRMLRLAVRAVLLPQSPAED